MSEARFKAAPIDSIREQINPDSYNLLNVRDTKNEHRIAHYLALANVVGPLTVRERWNLLGEYGLEDIRTHIPLQESASSVARNIYTSATNRLYPSTAFLFNLIDSEANPSPLPPTLREDLGKLISGT